MRLYTCGAQINLNSVSTRKNNIGGTNDKTDRRRRLRCKRIYRQRHVLRHPEEEHTTNLVKGAPLTVTKNHIADGIAQAVLCNSGNANTCNSDGIEIAEKMSSLAAEKLGISKDDMVIASTGVIGQKLNITPIANGMDKLVSLLSETGEDEAAKAIMTTDTVMKKVAVEFEIGGI